MNGGNHVAAFGPRIVAIHDERGDEARIARLAGEDADDPGAAAHFFVFACERVGGAEAPARLGLREDVEAEGRRERGVEPIGDCRDRGAQLWVDGSRVLSKSYAQFDASTQSLASYLAFGSIAPQSATAAYDNVTYAIGQPTL